MEVQNTMHGIFSDSDAAFRRDRLRIILRPCVTRHKFRLFTGFATGRSPEHPPGRAPTESHTGDGNECRLPKKYTASGLVRYGGRPKSHFLARQVPTNRRRRTAAKTDSCGWVARCEIWPYLFLYDGRPFYEPRTTSHEPLFFHEPRVTRGDVVILHLLPCSGI